jgi:dCTP deaminase
VGILTDRDIQFQLNNSDLEIRPLSLPLQPTSVDLRLGGGIRYLTAGTLIDPRISGEVLTTVRDIEEQPYVLNPGEFVLASTLEWVTIPRHLVGILMGKSSLARIGLQVEAAGYVDPGWSGRLTLELKNLGPCRIVLSRGIPIAQIRFERLDVNAPTHVYGDPEVGSHYWGSLGPVAARFGRQLGPTETREPDPGA